MSAVAIRSLQNYGGPDQQMTESFQVFLPLEFYHRNMQDMREWARDVLSLKWTDVYAGGYTSGGRNNCNLPDITLQFDKEEHRLAFKMTWGF